VCEGDDRAIDETAPWTGVAHLPKWNETLSLYAVGQTMAYSYSFCSILIMPGHSMVRGTTVDLHLALFLQKENAETNERIPAIVGTLLLPDVHV
jgi:hypothetical protein